MKNIITALIVTNLAACSSTSDWSWDDTYSHDANVEHVEVVDDSRKMSEGTKNDQTLATADDVATVKSRIDSEPVPSASEASLKFQNDYRQHLLTRMNEIGRNQPNRSSRDKDINFYVRGLMQDLVSNMKYVNSSTPIAVTSFVMLDSDYQYADILGKQLSESFIHEVHKFGIPVIDFKTTDFVRVTPDGDFIFSKDYLELEGDLPIKYAVAGTLTKQLSGYLVNARVIGVESKAVVASAQGFLPNNVVNQLVSSGFNDGIPLSNAQRSVD